MNNQQLNEGLRPMDLKEMVYPTFDIDTYKSKMGEDRDVCVLSFRVKDRAPARDLMEFIEKGFNFVLDSDVSSGENDLGEYFVFVELERSQRLAEQIKDITASVKKLTGIEDWKFKYHKENSVHEVTEETISKIVPKTAGEYDGLMSKVKTENVKRFFNKTLMDDLTLENDIITIYKPFDKKIQLKWLQEEQHVAEAAVSLDPEASAETFWLTKVLGDYNINKVGDSFIFTNGDRSMTLQRIE